MVDSHLQSGILTWQSMEIDCQLQVAIQGQHFFCTCGLASFLQPCDVTAGKHSLLVRLRNTSE